MASGLKTEDLYSMRGKICIVTGGSSGLGSYMAHGFLAAGAARVYITARSQDTVQAKASELADLFDGDCVGVAGDLSTLDGVDILSRTIREKEDHGQQCRSWDRRAVRTHDGRRLGQDNGPQSQVTRVPDSGVA